MATSDPRAAQAREHHRRSLEQQDQATRHRQVRDGLVRRLREEDPRFWTYQRLAQALGCSPELIAHIIKRK